MRKSTFYLVAFAQRFSWKQRTIYVALREYKRNIVMEVSLRRSPSDQPLFLPQTMKVLTEDMHSIFDQLCHLWIEVRGSAGQMFFLKPSRSINFSSASKRWYLDMRAVWMCRNEIAKKLPCTTLKAIGVTHKK